MSFLSIRSMARCMQGVTTASPLTQAFVTDFTRKISSAACRQLSFTDNIDATRLGLNTRLKPQDKKAILSKAVSLNPGTQPDSDVFKTKVWSIDSFSKPLLPVSITQLQNRPAFSSRVGNTYLRFSDLIIKNAHHGWAIPRELQQFKEPILKAYQFESLLNLKIADSYAYLSINQCPIPPSCSQFPSEWHTDSFIPIWNPNYLRKILPNSIYLVSDCLPTEFCAGPFPFPKIDPEDTKAVEAHFKSTAEGKKVINYPSYMLLRMGPNVVHRSGINTTKNLLHRTFFHLTFSREYLPELFYEGDEP